MHVKLKRQPLPCRNKAKIKKKKQENALTLRMRKKDEILATSFNLLQNFTSNTK